MQIYALSVAFADLAVGISGIYTEARQTRIRTLSRTRLNEPNLASGDYMGPGNYGAMLMLPARVLEQLAEIVSEPALDSPTGKDDPC